MPSVVKSPLVVDDRAERTMPAGPESPDATIIKRQYLGYRANPYTRADYTMPDKQGYVDEINRLKTEIAAQKAELRRMNRLVDEATEQEEAKAHSMEEDSEAEYADADKADVDEAARRLLAAARSEAERVVAEARVQAEAIAQTARANAEELREQTLSVSYLEGFEKATQDAQEEFRRENAPKIAELNALLERLSAYAEDQVAKNERSLVELVFAVARKILGREIEAEPRAVASMLYDMLDRNRREEDIRITVSPELLPATGKATDDIRKLITKTAPSATITVDSELAAGSMIVETPKGLVDLSVETRLQNLREHMLED